MNECVAVDLSVPLQPTLHILSQRVTERCRQREDDAAKMKETVEQTTDMIVDCRAECTTLTNTIALLDKKLEQTKEVCYVNLLYIVVTISIVVH